MVLIGKQKKIQQEIIFFNAIAELFLCATGAHSRFQQAARACILEEPTNEKINN